ncbi:MAG: Zn-ribbon domain-containing OB-fold protein [Archaeoglobaceae archaeon]
MVTRYEGIPFVARFRWSVGELFDEFLNGLRNAKLIASKCSCGYTVLPPRVRCPKCYAKLSRENLVEISGKGVIEAYTRVFFKLDGNGNEIWLDKPVTLAMVKFEGVNSTLVLPYLDTEISEGTEVEVVWRDERSGSVSDILGVRRVKV